MGVGVDEAGKEGVAIAINDGGVLWNLIVVVVDGGDGGIGDYYGFGGGVEFVAIEEADVGYCCRHCGKWALNAVIQVCSRWRMANGENRGEDITASKYTSRDLIAPRSMSPARTP